MTRNERRKAILRGIKSAKEAHASLGSADRIGKDSWLVDVFSVIDEFRLPLLFRPLKGLLGAFVPKPYPGIIINSDRQRTLQRITAAHEFGHFFMEHKPSVDSVLIGRMPTIEPDDHPELGFQEIEAEAFASEFLLPKWLLIFHLERQGYTPQDLVNPHVVYQISLRVGASYKATVWALHSHSMLMLATALDLAKIQPKALKQEIDQDHFLENSWANVWVLNSADDGTVIDANPDDLIYYSSKELVTSGYSLSTSEIKNAEIISDHYSKIANPNQIGANPERELVISNLGISGTINTFQMRKFAPSAERHSELCVDFVGYGSEFGLPKNARAN